MIRASHYLPINDSRVPDGEIAPVAGTPFDFRKPKTWRAAAVLASADRAHRRLRPLLGADKPDRSGPAAAELYLAGERRAHAVRQPARPAGLRRLSPEDGLSGLARVCLEPENFPDAPNHANFPSSILRPGETHRSFMSFTFSV
jgi:aldose 1-epimerase